MASIFDAVSEAFSERLSILKFIIYAIPVYFCIEFYVQGETNVLSFWGTLTAIMLFALITQGISNVRDNKNEILSLNPLSMLKVFVKSIIAVLPQALVFIFIANNIVTNVKIPLDYPNTDLIFKIIVYSFFSAVILTTYLSFAKYEAISDAYNYKIICKSCLDVFLAFLFFIPQVAFANLLIIGPIAYLFYFIFHIPFTNWGFLFCVAVTVVINVSIIANYFAQMSYEQISNGNDDEENSSISKVIEDIDSFKKT